MKQKDVFNKIGGIIKELSDQYEYLETVIDDLNDLELELFVSNAHFLTDHIEILCKLNLQKAKAKRLPVEKPEPVKLETPYKEKYFEPVVQQMKNANGVTETPAPKVIEKLREQVIDIKEEQPSPQIDLASAAPEETYAYVREQPEMIRHELVLDEADDDEPFTELEVITETLEQEEKVIPQAMAEQEFLEDNKASVIEEEIKPVTAKADDDEVLTINQKMSSQLADKAVSKTDQSSIKPISDIKLAITLNDKLLYVKDLFNGYNLAYSEAIEILNRFNTFEEASRFLKTNYVTKNNWDNKPGTTEKFYALLRRRYA